MNTSVVRPRMFHNFLSSRGSRFYLYVEFQHSKSIVLQLIGVYFRLKGSPDL